MEKYIRVEASKPEESINKNEIRVTTQGKMRRYISYATTLLQEKQCEEITLKAMGKAINKTVQIAEIIKRRIPGLHQITSIDSTPIRETYTPTEEGLEQVETMRAVSSILISLYVQEPDTTAMGYQPPIPDNEVRSTIGPSNAFPRNRGRGRGGRARGGRGRSRGRGGRFYSNSNFNRSPGGDMPLQTEGGVQQDPVVKHEPERFERGGERFDRGGERFDRGGDRGGDRGYDRGVDRGGDRGGDRGYDRGYDRGMRGDRGDRGDRGVRGDRGERGMVPYDMGARDDPARGRGRSRRGRGRGRRGGRGGYRGGGGQGAGAPEGNYPNDG